ncbi:MAG: BamA/TamA family outer membrane protein [Planctomycetaceae bacterium]|nr:BamA/TamA family outer membrane protein [Planctomycetaceae bacterium]
MANLRRDTHVSGDRRLVRLSHAALLLFVWPALACFGEETSDAKPAEPSSTSTAAIDKVVDVRIQGNKTLPLDKILPSIRTRPGRPFDQELIEEDVRRLDHTRQFVNVKTYWQQVRGGRVVIFDVVERPVLREVKYLGCKQIHMKTLKKQAEIKVGDPADPFQIEEARRKLEEFYRSHGYTGARVTLLEGDKQEDRRAIFLINEGTKQKVWQTQFIGNTIASDDRLRTQIKTSRPFLFLFKGELDRKQLDEDVKQLTGYYRGLGFFQARIGRELEFNEAHNWVTVTFVIDEGPRYKVRNVSVLGNTKYKSEELTALLKLKDGIYFNQAQMTADVTAMQDKYGAIGYVFADVKADPRFMVEPGQLDLVYNIKEGDRYRVGKINVDIRGDYPHTQLTTILNRLSFRPGDVVDIREIRASERRIKYSQLFENNPAAGMTPKIVFSPPGQDGQSPEEDEENKSETARRPKRRHGPDDGFRGQSPDTTRGERTVDVTLDCGRYVGPNAADQDGASVRRIVVPSNPSTSNDLLRMAVDLRDTMATARTGRQPLGRVIPTQYTEYAPTPNQTDANNGAPLRWTATSGAASSTAGSQTAATQSAPAQTSPSYGQPLWPRTGGGPQHPVESPQGPYVPGPIFSESSPFRGAPLGGGEDLRDLPITIRANEAMTGRIMVGAGINSEAGLVGSVILDEQNFDWTRWPTSWEEIRNGTAWRGAGQRFRIDASPGTETSNYAVTYQDPFVLNTQWSLGLSGFWNTRIYNEYTQEQLGGRIAIGRQLTPDLAMTLAYRGAKVNITDIIDDTIPDLAEVAGRDLAMHCFKLTTSLDKRDSTFLATEGFLAEGSIEQVLGSYQYPRVELDLRKYFKLHERPDGSGRHVLTVAGRAGWVGEDAPIYDRYYAGGFSTIRGFSFRGASPAVYSVNADEVVRLGGDFMLLGSLEYMFPITADDMLRGVVFCDTGTVEPQLDNWNNRYRVAAGFGLRISVPAMGPAPIALDFAFPISWQPGDKGELFSFFMGFTR